MKELTPELYTELNKTINALRKEKKQLEEELTFKENQTQSLNNIIQNQVKRIHQLTDSTYSPKLKEVNAFIQDYFSNIFKPASEYCGYHGEMLIDNKVFETAIKCNSYIIWAYLLGNKAELDKSMLEPPKDGESLEEYINRLKDKEE
jgi:chromosome segregation ATPase